MPKEELIKGRITFRHLERRGPPPVGGNNSQRR
jgi:translation initiation factor IF-1